jgi:hypothetical protein
VRAMTNKRIRKRLRSSIANLERKLVTATDPKRAARWREMLERKRAGLARLEAVS